MKSRRSRDEFSIAGVRLTIPGLALLLMLIGILAPPVFYAIRLSEPTPRQLITTICISLFASVLFLWILDATEVLRFRSAWVSRSVYTIGVAAIISATVGIYKDAFTDHLHPFDGLWRLSAWSGAGERIADNHEIVLYFSKSANAYTGYSSYVHAPSSDPKAIRHIRIERFDPRSRTLIGSLLSDATHSFQLSAERVDENATSFEFISGHPDTIGSVRDVFTRP